MKRLEEASTVLQEKGFSSYHLAINTGDTSLARANPEEVYLPTVNNTDNVDEHSENENIFTASTTGLTLPGASSDKIVVTLGVSSDDITAEASEAFITSLIITGLGVLVLLGLSGLQARAVVHQLTTITTPLKMQRKHCKKSHII